MLAIESSKGFCKPAVILTKGRLDGASCLFLPSIFYVCIVGSNKFTHLLRLNIRCLFRWKSTWESADHPAWIILSISWCCLGRCGQQWLTCSITCQPLIWDLLYVIGSLLWLKKGGLPQWCPYAQIGNKERAHDDTTLFIYNKVIEVDPLYHDQIGACQPANGTIDQIRDKEKM